MAFGANGVQSTYQVRRNTYTRLGFYTSKKTVFTLQEISSIIPAAPVSEVTFSVKSEVCNVSMLVYGMVQLFIK